MSQVSGLSIAALIFGILSLFISWLPLFGLIFVIATLILSFVALNRIKKSKKRGQGMAIAGIVMGFLSLIPALLITVGLFGIMSIVNEEPSNEKVKPQNQIAVDSTCISEVKNLLGDEILLEYNLGGNINQNQNCLTRFPNAKVELTECSKPKDGFITVYGLFNPLHTRLYMGKETGENPNYLYGDLEFNVAYSSGNILDEDGLIKGKNIFRSTIFIENVENYYPNNVDIQNDKHIFHISPIQDITFRECNMGN